MCFILHSVHNELFHIGCPYDAIQLKIIKVRKKEYSHAREGSCPLSQAECLLGRSHSSSDFPLEKLTLSIGHDLWD